tara:strand:- start:23242 stop:23559 length:318 start_codon:yes stop_codon:yes gene_type:complete
MNEKQILDRLDQLAQQASETARAIYHLRVELLVSKSSSRTRKEKAPRHRWSSEDKDAVRRYAMDGQSPHEIAERLDFEVSANAVQAQMYAMFPGGNRSGLNFEVR